MVGDLLMTFSHVQAYTNNFYTHIDLNIINWILINVKKYAYGSRSVATIFFYLLHYFFRTGS